MPVSTTKTLSLALYETAWYKRSEYLHFKLISTNLGAATGTASVFKRL